jgi:hypothetical protein
MTQEEKQLLLIDLCARLPYRVIVDVSRVEEWKQLTLTPFILSNYYDDIEKIKPYLRPLSSMTIEERIELKAITKGAIQTIGLEDIVVTTDKGFDYLNAHHIDYRGLIPMGLALEAPEDMYKTE